MIKTAVLIVAFLLFSAFDSFSQNPPFDTMPLLYDRELMNKRFENGKKQGDNIDIFELENEVIEVTYYKSNCPDSVEKEIILCKETVLEIEIKPKKPLIFENAPQYYKSFREKIDLSKYALAENKNLYWRSLYNDIDILVKTIKINGVEYIESEFYFASEPFLFHECVQKNLKKDSAFSLLKEVGVSFEQISPKPYYIIFSESELEEFSLDLLKSPDNVGLVMIYKPKDENLKNISNRSQKICDFVQKKGADPKKLIFIDGGSGSSSDFQLISAHKSFITTLGEDFNPLYKCK